MPNTLTLVTATYRAEDALLRLQARSLAQFVGDQLLAKIIVIDNGTPKLSARRQRSLLRAYGPLAGLVEIVSAPQIADLSGLSGWLGQQILKLEVARRVPTPWYVLLDAKNHAVRSLSIDDFLDPTGRAHGGFHSYATHPLRPTLLRTLEYLGLPDSAADRYPPTATPFVMHTPTVLDILDSFGDRLRPEFALGSFTEFFLYSGWILRRDGDWDSVYDGEAIQCPTIWGGNSGPEGVQTALNHVADTNAPFFGVHRRGMLRLRGNAAGNVAEFWLKTGLMSSKLDAWRFRGAFLWEFVMDALSSRLRHSTRPGQAARG